MQNNADFSFNLLGKPNLFWHFLTETWSSPKNVMAEQEPVLEQNWVWLLVAGSWFRSTTTLVISKSLWIDGQTISILVSLAITKRICMFVKMWNMVKQYLAGYILSPAQSKEFTEKPTGGKPSGYIIRLYEICNIMSKMFL